MFQILGCFQAQAAPQALFVVPLLRLHSDHAVCTLDKVAHHAVGSWSRCCAQASLFPAEGGGSCQGVERRSPQALLLRSIAGVL